MKIKKRIIIIALLSVAICTTSCRFSEECTYTGKVDIRLDWDLLWGNIIRPDSLNAIFYKEGVNPIVKGLYGDTIYNDIPSGNTEIFVFNSLSNIQLRGFETINSAELHLPTYFEGNRRIIKESPMICTFTNNVHIPIDGVVKQDMSPVPIVKQLIFNVNIIKKGAIGQPNVCNGSLSGISSGYSLSTKTALRRNATILFSLNKNKEDSFSHRFYVLGINPSLADEEVIPKKLNLTVLLEDGESKTVEVDMTDKFNEFRGNTLECSLEITISALSSSVEIVKWAQGESNDIIIQ